MTFYLNRFINAQSGAVLGFDYPFPTFEEAKKEIQIGNKKTHWIWYVFPQLNTLGKSELSKFYGLKGREEATE